MIDTGNLLVGGMLFGAESSEVVCGRGWMMMMA